MSPKADTTPASPKSKLRTHEVLIRVKVKYDPDSGASPSPGKFDNLVRTICTKALEKGALEYDDDDLVKFLTLIADTAKVTRVATPKPTT